MYQEYPLEAGRKLPSGYTITITPFSSIEFARAVRQPGPCVRALREAVAQMLSKNMTCARLTTPAQCNAKRTLSSHFTVHDSHPALRTSHLHLALHLTSNHVSSSHFSSALLISSHLFSHVIKVSSSQLFSSYPSTDQPLSSPRSSSQLILAVLHAKKLLLSESSPLHKKPLGAESFCTQTDTWDTNAFRQKSLSENFVLKSLHKSTSQYYFALQSLHKKTPQYYFVLQSLHEARPSTTLYCKVCAKYFPVLLCTSTKHFPVLLCTTKLAQSTSQYCFVLQSLHKALPSTTLYCKACTKHFPVLLCTTKLEQALPSTTLYYKARTKHVPVLLCTAKLARSPSQYIPILLCTTKLAQSTSQYYCALQRLHKVLPSTTVHYKACTKYFPAKKHW